jgi:hypothetical protein
VSLQVHDPAGGELGDPFFDLRETLKILFICTVNGETVYRVSMSPVEQRK